MPLASRFALERSRPATESGIGKSAGFPGAIVPAAGLVELAVRCWPGIGDDVLVGSSVYFMKLFGVVPDSRVLAAYAERCIARPAYAKALARDAELDA
jgi:hypothetical protein